ncbi:MAG: hypothetical protein ABI912_02000 [Actinomycetota bacterium]
MHRAHQLLRTRAGAEGLDLGIHQPSDALATLDHVVRDMHARSGLTDAVLASTVTLEEAQAQALATRCAR